MTETTVNKDFEDWFSVEIAFLEDDNWYKKKNYSTEADARYYIANSAPEVDINGNKLKYRVVYRTHTTVVTTEITSTEKVLD